jgi:hypothetical protein
MHSVKQFYHIPPASDPQTVSSVGAPIGYFIYCGRSSLRIATSFQVYEKPAVALHTHGAHSCFP